ncbi:MAG: carboxy terminal-processing peptidase [Bacteroidetes bacterium]|nr:carboxy terminal-processing peptidase [Fibrella sp.]
MKKYLIMLVPVLMLSFQPDSPSSSAPTAKRPAPTADDLQPSESQEKVEQLVANILTKYHYRKVRLNDSLSSVIWTNYLKEVDNSKTYLLASDIAAFEKYRTQLDDALINGDLAPAYAIYNVFRKRFEERSEFIKETLKTPFNFSSDETFNTDREKSAWPKDIQEQNDIWRKVLKNQALELKLAGQKDSTIVTTMASRYKNLDKALSRIKSEDVFQMYMNSFAEALDPHTNYLSPKASDRFNQEMSQSLEGIGAMLREDGEYIKIVDIVPGGPAFKSKQFTKEDKVVGVAQGDGAMVSIIGYQVDDAVKLIKGAKGTVVRLQIRSATALASEAPKEIRLIREKIKLEDSRAKKEVIELSENGKPYKIGVITIPIFYRDFDGARKKETNFSSTTGDVKRFVDSLKLAKVDGIVIDLRNNGGGSLTEAIDLTGLFIQKGPVVQVRESSGETEVLMDPDPSVTYEGPLAVLVNRFSASASEIFAAAIQDYKRGIIVGGQTYGKGTVQTLIPLNQWLPKEPEKVGEVKMTVQKFYRINGSSTQHKGVTPDVELPSNYSAEEFGESSQPSALPWDQIATTRYDVTRSVDDKVLARIRDKFEQRLKSDPELKLLAQKLADDKKARKNTVVSLQESKRRKERDEAEKKRAALSKLDLPEDEEIAAGIVDVTGSPVDSTRTAPSGKASSSKNQAGKTTPVSVAGATTPAVAKKKKDLYLTETGRILADMIAASGRPQ